MIDPELDRYERMFGAQRQDVKRLLATATRSEQGARTAKSVLRARLRRAGIDPDDDNPFAAVVPDEARGGKGVSLGRLDRTGAELTWRHEEVPYSGLFIGSPGMGKTSAILSLLIQLAIYYTIVVVDLRGDYECLCRVIPGARFLPLGSVPLNLLRGPSRVPPAVFSGRLAEAFTDQFDQRQSSRRYLSMVLDSLEARRIETGHWPCLLDLQDALKDRKEQRGSDESRFNSRCLARVDAIRRALTEESVGVEQGIDLEGLIESRATLIFRMELDKSVQDFLTNWLLMYVFEHRTWSENKFEADPVIFVLDEQRSILRTRR